MNASKPKETYNNLRRY